MTTKVEFINCEHLEEPADYCIQIGTNKSVLLCEHCYNAFAFSVIEHLAEVMAKEFERQARKERKIR